MKCVKLKMEVFRDVVYGSDDDILAAIEKSFVKKDKDDKIDATLIVVGSDGYLAYPEDRTEICKDMMNKICAANEIHTRLAAEDIVYHIVFPNKSEREMKKAMLKKLLSYNDDVRKKAINFLKKTLIAMQKVNKKYSALEKMAKKQKLSLTKENIFV